MCVCVSSPSVLLWDPLHGPHLPTVIKQEVVVFLICNECISKLEKGNETQRAIYAICFKYVNMHTV